MLSKIQRKEGISGKGEASGEELTFQPGHGMINTKKAGGFSHVVAELFPVYGSHCGG